jgi:hypothetical protein
MEDRPYDYQKKNKRGSIMRIADKLFTIDGGEVLGMSSNFRDKVERIFYEAVLDRTSQESYLDGVEVVLESMNKHGMRESAIIVERNLVADGVIEVIGDGDNEEDKQEKKAKTDESRCYADIVAGMIG